MDMENILYKSIIKSNDINELLLKPNKKRFVLFPIIYNDIYQLYKKAESSFWTVHEIDLSKDLNDWTKLNDDEKKNIEKKILKNDSFDNNINKISIEVIIYEIKYFRFYLTITELLFDSKCEDNELYNFILIFIKNKNN